MNAERDPGGQPVCWALIGPTASGKSAVAMALAQGQPVEILSVDSMQVYRGMDIGTAKPSAEERRRVRHHMIDVLDPSESCNVGRFCAMAEQAIAEIHARGNRPLLVGGTALYFKGLLWGLADAPSRDPELRRRLRAELREVGKERMHARLERLDPEAAARIHPNDVQRLVRALEVCELTGEAFSAGQGQFDSAPIRPHRMVGLRMERSALYRRIDRRVDSMMEAGLLEELKALRGQLGPQSRQALGYKELMQHLDGEVSLAEAVDRIKRNTRRFAKHQLTWFRHFPQVDWVQRAGGQDVVETARRCEERLMRLDTL